MLGQVQSKDIRERKPYMDYIYMIYFRNTKFSQVLGENLKHMNASFLDFQFKKCYASHVSKFGGFMFNDSCDRCEITLHFAYQIRTFFLIWWKLLVLGLDKNKIQDHKVFTPD